MLLSTTSTIDNYSIEQYYGIVCHNIVIGSNLFSDIFASFSDVFGGHSGTYQSKMDNMYQEAIKNLSYKARQLGANAVVGIKIDFDEISEQGKQIFMLCVTGTAVNISKKSSNRYELYQLLNNLQIFYPNGIITEEEATFRTNRTSPIQAMRNAAETLYLKTKPYVGCQTLPQGQQIQKMRGLLADITTTEMSAHITTLGLSAVVEELGTIIAQYSALIEQRSASQLANKLDAGKTVRLEFDEQYDDLVSIAFVTSVATPSKEATDFVVYMNKLIADTETAYNQRVAQRGKKEETEVEKE